VEIIGVEHALRRSLCSILLLTIFSCNTDSKRNILKEPSALLNKSFDELVLQAESENIVDDLWIDSLSQFYDSTVVSDENARILFAIALSKVTMGRYNDAQKDLEQLMKMSLVNEPIKPRILSQFGIVSYYKGDIGLAEQFLRKSYALDSINSNYPAMIKNLSRRSTIAHDQLDFKKAIRLQKQAILEAKKLGDSTLVSQLNMDLGPSYVSMNLLDSAKPYVLAALKQQNTLPDHFTALINYSLWLQRSGVTDSAISYLKDALKIAKALNSRSDLALCYNNLAYLNFELGSHKLAFEQLDTSVSIATEVRDKDFAQSLRELELKYENLSRDSRLKELELDSEKSAQYQQWVVISSVLTILALLGFVLFFRNKLKTANQIRQSDSEKFEKQKQLLAVNVSLAIIEQERKRFAMDIHDGIGVSASTANLLISQAINRTESLDVVDLLKTSMEALKSINSETRRIAYNMMPTILANLGLAVAVEDLIDKVSQSTRIQIQYQIDSANDRKIESGLEISLFRIVQELLNNGIKHSRAELITIYLLISDDEVFLNYSDDGVGLKLNNDSSGHGISSMRSRIEFHNGVMNIDRTFRKGTSIQFNVPLYAKS